MQDTDSNIASVRDKIDQLNIQAWEVRISDSIEAFKLSKEAVKLAEKSNYVKGNAEALRTLGFCYIRFSKYAEAQAFLEKALMLLKEIDDKQGQSDVYEYFGIIKRSLGDYKSSLEFLFQSLNLREETHYHEGIALALYHLGVTYKYLGNLEQALDNLMKSLSIARLYNFWAPESYSLNNIGMIFFETSNYSNALNYFHQSLRIRRKSGDKWGEAGCLDNIGFCHFKMRDYGKAISFCNKSLTIAKSTGDQKGYANSLFHLGNIYNELNKFNKALDYYHQSLHVRQEIGDLKGKAEIFLFLARVYMNNNFSEQNTSRAFELMNEALLLGDEIKAEDLLANIHYGLYDVCKKSNLPSEALGHLEKYISFEKQVHSDAINKKILNIEIAQYEKQIVELEAKALRAQMNPHFIFNCLNSIKALIQKNEQEKAIDYLITFSKLIRTVFQNSDKREITLYDEIETCRLYTKLESMRFGNKFRYEFDINEMLDLKSVMVPALIIQPFIENAIWHGIMPKEEGGNLKVKVTKTNHTVNCIIEDDGIGRDISKQNKFPDNGNTHESKGEHLTQSRLDLDNLLNERNATIEILDKQNGTDKSLGTTVILTFKDDQA